ncbi:hypothetical protein GCM10017044_09040 [Kordiimonas sediminis]|uniref:Tetratricopeptide repeat protein n=1 Tax=Kordiimonas sediminis TaxID=1735581 RepID=A0A919E5T8_9PROT|nr:CDC27 family protein [Kordiimonas sediminis]GHF16882.1 hypothetical protein GCM10017044_09040 [Kordiimonas sediminis]
MKMKLINNLPMAVAAFAIAAAALPEATPFFGSEAAFAQSSEDAKPKRNTRKVPAMSQGVHKKIQVAQEALEAKNYAEAKEGLDDVLSSTKINDYERAVAWQIKAMLAYEQDDPNGTITAYEKILTFSESIPEALELQIIFGLAQLYFTTENYDKALDYVNQWEPRAEIVGITQLMFIGQLHYVRSDFRKALDYVYRAISDAESVDTIEVKESWYQLAMSSHWELNEFDKVRDVLEVLLINWPKPLYWTQLAGVYGELGQEQTSFSITEAAYKQGFLDDKEIQLVNLAQILIARQAPIKATWVLEKAFKEERVEKSAKNYKTLGQAYMMANEYERAVDPLKKAAAGDQDGDLWFQIAQVNMQLDRHADAIAAFERSIELLSKELTGNKEKDEKTKEKIFNSYMQIGTAHTEMKNFDDAKKAFASARKSATSDRERRAITQWTNYMKAEKAREDMLTGDD